MTPTRLVIVTAIFAVSWATGLSARQNGKTFSDFKETEENIPSTPFLPCAEKRDPIAVRVSGCKELPCQLVKGTDVVAEVDYEVDHDTETLRPVVIASVLGMTVNFPLEQQDACLSLTNAECPLDKEEEITYQLKLPISKLYPTVDMAVEVSLVDGENVPLTCFKITGQVVDPS